MHTMTRGQVYSPKQARLVRTLTAERNVPVAGRDEQEAWIIARYEDLLGNHDSFNPEHDRVISTREASAVIDWLFKQPKRVITPARAEKPADLTPGVYEPEAGRIYVVKPNREGTRLYAKRLVEINADRVAESGDTVQIEFEYDRGAIFSIKPEHRMPLERAEQLTLRYGRCINCGRKLKAAKSVRQGIGPVCIKSFRV
jgi:hypothetical protein